MKKFEFELSNEAAQNILGIIHAEIVKFRYEKQISGEYTEAEIAWFKRAADALEVDYNIIIKGMK